MTDMEFQNAIDRMLKGDKEGLRCIYEEYMRFIYAVVYDTVGRREDAEDVTSEFFIKLVRVAGTYKKGSPHKAWMATIAKNMAIDMLRKRSREVYETENKDEEVSDRSLLDSGETIGGAQATVEDKAVMAEDMAKALNQLEPKEREIIDLKLTGQFKFKEISQMMGQPIGTVTWIYNQGIKKLRRYLADYGKE